jgi:hypothetical protein
MYQRLEGGSGRAVYFRAPRLGSAWLAGSNRLGVRVGSSEGLLKDVSFGGMLVESRQGIAESGEVSIEVSLDGNVLYTGTGIVVRQQRSRIGFRAGVKILKRPIEPRELRRRVRSSLFESAARGGVSVYQSVPAKYRAAIADAAVTLTYWRDLLDRREREILAEESNDRSLRDSLGHLEEVGELGLRVDWIRAKEQAIVASDEIIATGEQLQGAKRLTEAVLTPILSCAPIWSHAFEKPRGYPGDFELMNYMYDSSRKGATIFARIIHQLGREERLAATVRDRRVFLSDRLTARGKSGPNAEEEFRITNLGSGPARELEDLLSLWDRPRRLVLTLIDQDEDALEFADRRLRSAANRFGCNVEIRCRYLSFRQLFRDSEFLRELVGQDVLYSAGFFDYLRDDVAEALLAGLFSLLRNDGLLLIGNAVDAREVKWVPEFVLDWQLLYRTPDDMRRLCKSISDPHRISLSFDGSGAWQFLEVERLAH